MTEVCLSRGHTNTCLQSMPLDANQFRFGSDAGELIVEGFHCPVENLVQYVRGTIVHDASDISKLNALAGLIEGMELREQETFSGALNAESVNGLDDILRIAESLEQYELIVGVNTDRALGGWLVENNRLDVDFPKAVRPYLDYAAIGAKYYADQGGAYTAHGYVKRKEAVPELAAEETAFFHAQLTAGRNSAQVTFPASEEQLERLKKQLGADDFCRVDILGIRIRPGLDRLMDKLPQGLVTVEEINAIAFCLQDMEQENDGIRKYCAILEVENPATFSDAVTIAMDLDDYELIPEDMDEYGKQVLRRAGADDEVIDTVDGYMDFAQLGKDAMQEEGVRRTEYGLVRRISAPFPVVEIGQTMC